MQAQERCCMDGVHMVHPARGSGCLAMLVQQDYIDRADKANTGLSYIRNASTYKTQACGRKNTLLLPMALALASVPLCKPSQGMARAPTRGHANGGIEKVTRVLQGVRGISSPLTPLKHTRNLLDASICTYWSVGAGLKTCVSTAVSPNQCYLHMNLSGRTRGLPLTFEYVPCSSLQSR